MRFDRKLHSILDRAIPIDRDFAHRYVVELGIVHGLLYAKMIRALVVYTS